MSTATGTGATSAAAARAASDAPQLIDATIVAIFDAANTADMETGALAAVTTTLLPAIGNAELRELVVKVGPAFEAHMIGARSLERRLASASDR